MPMTQRPFLVERGRLAAVDDWEQKRIVEVRVNGERRRHKQHQARAAVGGFCTAAVKRSPRS